MTVDPLVCPETYFSSHCTI